MRELQDHLEDDCEMPAAGGVENAHGKVNILLQTFISRGNVDSFSLVSDSAYVAQVSKQEHKLQYFIFNSILNSHLFHFRLKITFIQKIQNNS